jgi:uncharacterized protein YfiM (DUF2279 family)
MGLLSMQFFLGKVMLENKCYKFLIVVSFCMIVKTGFAVGYTDESYMATKEVEKETFLGSLKSFDDWPPKKKVVALNAAAVGTTVLAGAASWDYYSSSFKFKDEGWFDPDTNYGGADKLGHAYSAYVLTCAYNSIYKKWGYSDEKAILGGALSSWSLTTLIELGDGFSKDYGFSWQDETMNTLGVGLAYLRHRYPSLKEKFDFRMEWFPSPAFRHGDRFDPFTDYSGQKYLIALKPDGFLKTDNPFLKAVELHFGYYSRGYLNEDKRYFNSENRYTYIGVGLNMTYLLEKLTGHKAGGIFDYVQVPFTYIPFSSKLD